MQPKCMIFGDVIYIFQIAKNRGCRLQAEQEKGKLECLCLSLPLPATVQQFRFVYWSPHLPLRLGWQFLQRSVSINRSESAGPRWSSVISVKSESRRLIPSLLMLRKIFVSLFAHKRLFWCFGKHKLAGLCETLPISHNRVLLISPWDCDFNNRLWAQHASTAQCNEFSFCGYLAFLNCSCKSV
jgi:hypothetical protein